MDEVEKSMVTVTFMDGSCKKVPVGTKLVDLLPDIAAPVKIVGAKVDNNYRALTFMVKRDSEVEFLDLSHAIGWQIYMRSVAFLLLKAVEMLFPRSKVQIEHSFGRGIYGELKFADGHALSAQELVQVEQQMRALAAQKIAFQKRYVFREDMIATLSEFQADDQIKLLKYGIRDTIDVYECDGCIQYFSGYLVPDSGYLDQFSLQYYAPGFILSKVNQLQEPIDMKKREKLFHIYHESEEWQNIMAVSSVGELNDHIVKKQASNLICIAEAFQEKKIAQIADSIAQNREKLRLVLISGPSSSGKTTFAQRLAIQMKINGLKPVSISLDDYFVDRELTPKDEFGEPDFEALETIDLALFNEQLAALIAGKEVDLPSFNFKLGKREYWGRKLKINRDQPLIIEGIHALNSRLTASIARENKFNVYISALTQINLDRHNRIPTTDCRLIRRIVRDSQFRNLTALDTLRMWPSVRRGEEKNIFPFQDEADIMFNSSLVYELAVLKKYVDPLLLEINSSQPEYGEARRLIKFLSYVLSIADQDIPATSILREFIGRSFFVH